MATNKHWYIRRENSSKLIKNDWVYYMSENCWTANISKAKKFFTKKAATAFISDNNGEVYGQ